MIIKIKILLILGLSVFACKGQNTSVVTNTTTAVGETVTEISKSIWMVFQAANGDYWFGSDDNGVYRFDGKIITQFTTKDGLSSNRIRRIQEDKLGNIYLSTLEGIDKFDGFSFRKLTPIPSSSPEDHWKLQKDDLWFYILGKYGEKGPLRYDGKNLYQLKFPKHYMEDEYYEKFPDSSWSPYDVYYIYKDLKGFMWFGTSNLGLCRYDGHHISWLYEDHLTNTPQGGSFGIRSILEDSNGKYWFCNTQYRYNIFPNSTVENGSDLIKYNREKGVAGITSKDGSSFVYFMSAVEDHKGNIWMATYDQGVWKYDGKNSTHYAVTNNGNDITLFSIYKDRSGDLWLGTHESGVFKFNGKSFEKFDF